MKYLLQVFIFCIIPWTLTAQYYAGFDIQTMNATAIESARGGFISGGYSFKKFYTGIGSGVYFFNDNKPYIPAFAEIGTKSFILAAFRIGYGFYKGNGYPIGEDKKEVKGGPYSCLKLGLSIKFDETNILIFAHDTYSCFGPLSKNFYGFGIGMKFNKL